MSIVSSSAITAYVGASSYTATLQSIHEGIERMIKNACDKTFESASYFELYDGLGGLYRLELKNQPVTAVSRVSVNLDAVIKIKNTNTDATTASIVVDSTNVTLTVNGGAGNSTSALAIATYTTLTLLVNAINALNVAYGWSAVLYDTDYSAKKTALLIPQQIDVTSWLTAEDYDYLYMGEPEKFTLIDNRSIEAYFPYGSQNIAVSYTTGSTPDDIELIIQMLVKSAYDRNVNDGDGLKSFTVGDIRMEYIQINEDSFVSSVIMRNSKIVV